MVKNSKQRNAVLLFLKQLRLYRKETRQSGTGQAYQPPG